MAKSPASRNPLRPAQAPITALPAAKAKSAAPKGSAPINPLVDSTPASRTRPVEQVLGPEATKLARSTFERPGTELGHAVKYLNGKS